MKQPTPSPSSDPPPATSDDGQEKRRRSQIPNSVRLFASWPEPGCDAVSSCPKSGPMSISDIQDKFTSPSRERPSASESKRRLEEKQFKAQELRSRLHQEKAQKHKEKTEKSQAIRARQEEQQQQKLAGLTTKLQKAEELRNQQITKIKKTAHEQELKVDEIHFINKIESEFKKHDVLTKEKDVEARLQDLHEERQRRKEEKQAREAAAEERKKVLEAEDQAKIEQIREKIREKDHKIEQQMLEKEKERMEQASHKKKEREKRLSAVNAAHLANVVELQKRIREKQEASEKRKQEAVDQKRQKAFELSLRRCSESPPHDSDHTPVSVPYDTQKMCSVCHVLIGSEIYLYSHLRGKIHQNEIKKQYDGHSVTNEDIELYNIKHIVDAPVGCSASDFNPELAKLDKKRLKSIKKRCSLLRQRLLDKAAVYESQDVQHLFPVPRHSGGSERGHSLSKLTNELSNVCDAKNNSSIESRVHSFGKAIKAIEKMFAASPSQRQSFARLGGLKLFSQIISNVNSQSPFIIPDKPLSRFLDLTGVVCYELKHNTLYFFNSNLVTGMLDLLELRLTSHLSRASPSRQPDPVISSLNRSLSLFFKTLCRIVSDPAERSDDMVTRVQEVISYIVSIGIVDKLSLCIGSAQGALDEKPELADFLMDSLSLLTCVTALLVSLRTKDHLWDENRPEDTTQFAITIRMTQIAGVVPLLYGMLLHTQIFSRGHSPAVVPPEAPRHALDIACLCVSLLNHVALLDLSMLQATLGSEGLSLQLRHISSYLLWYCGHWQQHKSLAHEIIRLLGFFALTNPENQAVLHSGQRPTILQQLCSMPFEYFSDPHLMTILFPTLISCCFENAENRKILEQEMSPVMLATFLETGEVSEGMLRC